VIKIRSIPDEETSIRSIPDESSIDKNSGKKSTLQSIAESSPVEFTLGMGDKLSNLMRSGANFVGANLPYVKTGEGTAYEIGKLAGDIAGFLGGGEIAGAARLGAEGLPYIGKAAQALGGESFLPRMSRRALGSAAFGALEDPENRLSSAATFGGISGILDASLGGLGKLRPSKLFRGTLSPEELQRNLDITRGTSTSLGDVIQSPSLKYNYENILAKIPGAGATNKMQETAVQVKDKGKELLARILGENEPENVKKTLNESLKKSYREAKEQKRDLYKKTEDIADQMGLTVGRSNLSSTSSNILQEIEKSPELKRQLPSSIMEDLQFYKNPENFNNLRRSNILKGNLGTEARKLLKSGDEYHSGIYSQLRDALGRDIEESIQSKGSPELKSEYDAAQKFYREKIVPFEDKDVVKFVRKGADPDLIISSFIKKGSNDRSNLLDKLAHKLPQSQKGLLPYGFLSSSLENGEFNPLKFSSLYKGLGENQRKSLIPDEKLRKDVEDYVKLVKMNTEPLTLMNNVKTGQRNLNFLPILISHSLGGIGGGLTGYNQGGAPGALAGTFLGALAGLTLPGLVGKQASKYLTSPSVREKIVKKMIRGNPQSREEYAKALAQSLAEKYRSRNGNGNGS